MTDRQKQVYDFIVAYTKENLYPPSIREIGEGTRLLSTSSVYNHIKALETQGYIEVRENQPRAIKIKGYKFVLEVQEVTE